MGYLWSWKRWRNVVFDLKHKQWFVIRIPESLNSIPVLLLFLFSLICAVINENHNENCVLLNSVQEFNEIEAWGDSDLFPMFSHSIYILLSHNLPPKCPYSYFSKALEFYLREVFPCEYL